MKIKELVAGSKRVEIEVSVLKKGDVREVKSPNFTGEVCTCIVEDDTSQIEFTAWDEEIGLFEEGDTIKIENGYVRSDKEGNNLSLTAGRYGKLSKVEDENKD